VPGRVAAANVAAARPGEDASSGLGETVFEPRRKREDRTPPSPAASRRL